MLNIIVISFLQLAYSHGEEHPGPHGGKIQMPGAFHTEVLSKKDKVQIFLLDMNFENPTVDNSTLTAYFKANEKKQKLTCDKNTNSFSCHIPKNLAHGQLILEAMRSGAKGNEAIYEWPLK